MRGGPCGSAAPGATARRSAELATQRLSSIDMGAPLSRLEGKPSGQFECHASHVPEAMAVSSTGKTRCLGLC